MPSTNIKETYKSLLDDDNMKLKISSPPKPFERGCLFAGAHFTGQQTTSRKQNDVSVLLKTVDFNQGFACGYLQISCLVPDHPILTTFFEAEIIGEQHKFETNKWGADDRIDEQHWDRFSQFDVLKLWHTRNELKYDSLNEDCVFMRWKELFLVPNHLARAMGTSYDGFYYMVCQLSTKKMNGYYFHKNSEWFQQMNLKYEEQNNFPSFDFC